jgi:hypothetical protein
MPYINDVPPKILQSLPVRTCFEAQKQVIQISTIKKLKEHSQHNVLQILNCSLISLHSGLCFSHKAG